MPVYQLGYGVPAPDGLQGDLGLELSRIPVSAVTWWTVLALAIHLIHLPNFGGQLCLQCCAKRPNGAVISPDGLDRGNAQFHRQWAMWALWALSGIYGFGLLVTLGHIVCTGRPGLKRRARQAAAAIVWPAYWALVHGLSGTAHVVAIWVRPALLSVKLARLPVVLAIPQPASEDGIQNRRRQVAQKKRVWREQVRARHLSMLDPEALAVVSRFAQVSSGAILEVGSYVGGSTICIALSKGRNIRPFVTVELGGAHETHPQVPSSDILADLRGNIRRFGLDDQVQVVAGWAHSPAVRSRVAQGLRGEKIGFFCVDANVNLRRIVGAYTSMLAENCLLAFDDYLAPGAPDKEAGIKPFIDGLIANGVVRELGVFGAGTWFGQINGASGLAALQALRPGFFPESGFVHIVDLILPVPPDTVEHPTRSELRLIEDGRPLGPRHSTHDDICKLGQGRYCHWGESLQDSDGLWWSQLHFAASDNSDPSYNGRTYTIEIGGTEIDLREA